MLTSGKMVGFVPTKDSKQARAFYEGKLGFQFVSDDQFALVMMAGQNTIRIAKGANFVPAQYTVLGWEVEDIQAVVRWLSERGVAFEKYPYHSGSGIGNLDGARRRQGRVAQGSGWECAVGGAV